MKFVNSLFNLVTVILFLLFLCYDSTYSKLITRLPESIHYHCTLLFHETDLMFSELILSLNWKYLCGKKSCTSLNNSATVSYRNTSLTLFQLLLFQLCSFERFSFFLLFKLFPYNATLSLIGFYFSYWLLDIWVIILL